MGLKPRRAPGTPRDALRAFSFGLPGAYEDTPWGESVAKVNKKVFVFFGVSENFGFSVKLPASAEAVLQFPFAKPTSYGLGKAGWVSIRWQPDVPVELMQEWIVESYRAIAPRSRQRELDEHLS